MKFIVLSVVCLGIGIWLQREQRPESDDLELRATLAWNEGDLTVAEREARLAFGRNPDSVRAREVLIRISDVLKRPEIHLAILLGDRDATKSRERTLTELGRVALASNLFRLADEYFTEGIRQFPENETLQRQFVALSGLRLDAEEMQDRLTIWAQRGRPTTDLVVMSLGLWSIDSRGATPSEAWLTAAFEADASDIDSRIGLARCLLAMGRYRECIQLLQAHHHHAKSGLLLALAYATTREIESAAIHLPSSEPAEMRADFWFTKGVIAMEQDDFLAAETAFQKAVQYRPLDQAYRSKYCEVLRRLDHTEQLVRNVKEFDTVVRIAYQSKQPGLTSQARSIIELLEMCRSVGADTAAELLSKSAGL